MAELIVDYNTDKEVFLISCPYGARQLVQGLPDRKFSKRTNLWTAPALRRNIEYLQAMRQPSWVVSSEADAALNIITNIKGENAEYKAFPTWYPFKIPPYKHQGTTLNKAFPLDFYAILFDQGLGKTFTSISLACAWRMTNQIDAVVVVCLSSIMGVWEEQIPEHAVIPVQVHALQAGPTASKSLARWAAEDHDFPALVVGIEALSNGSGFDKVLAFIEGRRCLIIVDESSSIKNFKAKRTDRVDHIARLPGGVKRIILSGTSVTEGVENWYSQYHFLEPNVVGFNNFYSYRNRFCITVEEKIDPTDPNSRTYTKIVQYKNLDELAQSVSFCTSRYEKDDVLDLPAKVHQKRYIKPSPAQVKALKELAEEGFTIVEGEDILCATALVKLLRLQQVTGGFYPVDNPDVEEAQPLPGPNPKIEDMLHYMDEVSGKVIVWCRFKAEHKLVCQTLERKGISYAVFRGGLNKTERQKAVDSFCKDASIQVFAVTYAAAYGLTLVECRDNYYYSLTPSADKYIQSEDRSHRIGTTGTVTYTAALLQGSPDGKLLTALNRKRAVAAQIYDLLED